MRDGGEGRDTVLRSRGVSRKGDLGGRVWETRRIRPR